MLEVIEREQLLENAARLGQYLMDELSRFPVIRNVRGAGLMIGFDVPDSYGDLRKNLLFRHHIFTGEAKGNVIRLLPPLGIEEDLLDDGLTVLEHAVRDLT